MNVRIRHHVVETGPPAGRVVLLAHGFGCDQHMWRLVAPRLAETFRVVTFDFVGSGRSDRSAWDTQRYSSLDGYDEDVAQQFVSRLAPARAPDVVEALIELLAGFGDGLDDDVAILAIGIPPRHGESSTRS